MATSLQTKELFNRADIRTMKKDLKKLREADALNEREKIKNPKVPASASGFGVARPVEQQKQQIFLAKSEKIQLEKELKSTPAPIKTNAILQEEKQLEEKLGAMTVGEEKKRWQQEQDLQKKKVEADRLTQMEKQRVQKEAETKVKITEIESSLKVMQGDVVKKEALKPAPAVTNQAPKPQSANSEELQRKKFLEDVEAWANAANKDN